MVGLIVASKDRRMRSESGNSPGRKGHMLVLPVKTPGAGASLIPCFLKQVGSKQKR
jgi:hypothetical protein